VDIYSYLEIVQFPGNHKFKEIVTLSTAEAEFVSLTECAKLRIWLKKFI